MFFKYLNFLLVLLIINIFTPNEGRAATLSVDKAILTANLTEAQKALKFGAANFQAEVNGTQYRFRIGLLLVPAEGMGVDNAPSLSNLLEHLPATLSLERNVDNAYEFKKIFKWSADGIVEAVHDLIVGPSRTLLNIEATIVP